MMDDDGRIEKDGIPVPEPIEEDIAAEKLYGHPRFYEIIEELKRLHSNKNHDYTAGGDPLGNFRRVATILSLYPSLNPADPIVVALTYALKQIDATLWMLSNKHTAKVEGIGDRMRDVAVYNVIAMILAETREV